MDCLCSQILSFHLACFLVCPSSRYIRLELTSLTLDLGTDMATTIIKYIWKIPKPLDPVLAHGLMSAAYKTAMETNPNTREVLIR